MPDGATPADPPASPTGLTGSAAQQRLARLAKVEALRERGIDPYPVTYPRDHTLAQIREEFGSLEAGAETDTVVHVAGRVMLKRDHGGLVFMQLKDESGVLQVMASRAEVGDDGFADVDTIDIGDWMGFEGRVVVSRRGELSVLATSSQLLGKAIRPLPAKARPLTDTETRARQRYLDLIVTPDARRVADVRTRTLAGIRGFLAGRGFTEVETPVLQPESGGATARPFITHHNALDIEMYMRIALELHLKRLIVGGYEKVFEMSRVFRNEGIDTRHNPEFTMLELYQALADYTDMMVITEEMVGAAAMAAIGTHDIEIDGKPVSLAPPWRRATMYELIKEHSGIDIHPSMPLEECRRIADEAEVEYEESWGTGKICNELYDEFVEANLVGPVFVCDHPREISPLARPHRDDRNPTEGVDSAGIGVWLIAAAVIVPLVGAFILIASRQPKGGPRAVLLGSSTGILYGAAAALTKSVMSYLDDGFVDVISSWELYALIVVITLGTYLQQSAFQAGSLAQSLPAISVVEPVAAVILGMTVLEEALRADGLEWALIAVAAVMMIAATAALARSQGESAPQLEPEPVPAPA